MKTQNLLMSIFALGLFLTFDVRADDQKNLKDEMGNFLENIGGIFNAQYAPAKWKQSHFNWDLHGEVDKIKAQVNAKDNPSMQDYQHSIRDFFQSTKDYHVGVQFYSTAMATLPFQVKGAEGKYFFVFIDRSKLDSDTFPFNEGDELIKFDGRPVADVIHEVQDEVGHTFDATDASLAEIYLTKRSGIKGMNIPTGVVTLSIKPKGSERVKSHEVIWDTTPEDIPDNTHAKIRSRNLLGADQFSILNRQMVTPLFDTARANPRVDNPFLLANRKGFLPPLGKTNWEASEGEPFYAYTYTTEDNRKIGYIRISEYGGQSPELFAEDIKKFESSVDALVIDQLNNPGGSVFYLYALVSMLTDEALTTPRHRMAITQADVFEAQKLVKGLSSVTSSMQAQMLLGQSLDGYPVSHQTALFILDYARFILNQWKMGHRVTDPYFIFGVDKINPSPSHFTKPILLLTNGLDFSGGDFFPAILQDNHRVTIMGTRTAGAGGYILQAKFPNDFGVNTFSVTGSLAERSDSNPIENLGVQPDIRYEITAADLQNHFEGYKLAINKAVTGLLPPLPPPPATQPVSPPATQPAPEAPKPN